MAWLWWLLAPVASTLLGATVLAIRARRDTPLAERSADAMAAHRRLTEALQRSALPSEPPLTMIVLQEDSSAG